MKDAWQVLQERGFIAQCSDTNGLRQELNSGGVTFYVGFDPTAHSLQVGNLVPILAMRHLQDCGHKPIVIGGGGTARIGDPSGRDEMRRVMSYKEIDRNLRRLKPQFARFLRFDSSSTGALLLNNAEWLASLNLIDFMREIGVHFNVSVMLSSAVYAGRIGVGLTFAEMSYQLLQSYDYLVLFERYDCILQMGGDDQWGNILAGVDLVRRLKQQKVFALTFPLLTTVTGGKMGKTAAGTIWLDAKLTSPFDFFQYWQAQPDQDLERNLKIFTLLSVTEIREILVGRPREAQLRLAYEVTKLVHGDKIADEVVKAAHAVFVTGEVQKEAIPTTEISTVELVEGLSLLVVLERVGLCSSRGDARRTLRQGGIYLNERRIDDPNYTLQLDDFVEGLILLRRGKRNIHRLKLIN